MLDRDKGDDMSKYRSSIASILGDSVATSICDGESVANASILGDLSVATPFTYASRKSARVDTTSPEETLDRPSSPPPVHRNHRGSDGHHHDRIFTLDGSYISRTGRRRGASPAAKKKLDPPTAPLPIRKSGAGDGQARNSTRDGSGNASRNGKRRDSPPIKKKLDPPSSTLPVHKSDAEGSARASTSTGHGRASATPIRKSHYGSDHARTSRSHSRAPVAKKTCASSTDGPPGVCYRVGETRASRAHSIPFDSPSQAAALLARLPLRSPLFVQRSDRQFTYAVLVERRPAEDGGGMSLVIALDSDGKRKKVLERRHWEMCLRLVNTRAVDHARSQ